MSGNGWSGGQYSLVRALLGIYLAIHFAHLIPWGAETFSSAGVLPQGSLSPLAFLFPNLLSWASSPGLVTALLAGGVALALAFALGWRDRLCALLLWYLWACLFGRNPLIANPSLPFIGWLLLFHALLPPAPFGSLAARGRTDPGGGWRLPPPLFAALWMVMALAYSYSGWTKLVSPSWRDGSALGWVLQNPLARPTPLRLFLLALPAPLLKFMTWGALAAEISFAPLAFFRRLRPWVWLGMVGMHLGLLVTIDFADLTLGMLLLHVFAFDPAWIPVSAPAGALTVFYDGGCGLCHRTIRFLLAEDAAGRFRFAPLDSEPFRAAVPAAERAALPDSLVLLLPDGTRLIRSDGIAAMLEALGGLWRPLGRALRALPRPLRDAGYDAVARVRKKIFPPPPAACPLLPPPLRERFLH